MADREITTLTDADPGARLDAFRGSVPDANELASSLGNPADWTASATEYLKLATSGRTHGSARVSIAALHLILAHVERLEGELGIISKGESA